MPLTAQETADVERLANEYDQSGAGVSFAAWMTAKGHAALLAELEAELEAAGDTETLSVIRATPEPAEEIRTPESLWQTYIEMFDAPLEGGPWALDKSGRWFEVTTQAPGGKVGTYQGRSIYIPPLHPDGEASTSQAYKPSTPRERRWTDQKFRMARAAILQDDPRKLWYDLFFRVAPRGSGPFGSGHEFYKEGISYTSEGGERWPELEHTDPKARELYDWWLQDFGHHFPEQGQGNPLSWFRVYTGPDGYRHYKAWSKAEMREFLYRWMLHITPGHICSAAELAGYLPGLMAEQAKWQAAHRNDYSNFWTFPLTPYSHCDAPTERRHKQVTRKLAKVAALAGVVWLGVTFGPALFAKMKGVLSKVGPKIAGAFGNRSGPSDADQSEVEKILTSRETQEAIARGELPPPPTSTADPAWSEYATVIAQWYMNKELAEQRQQIPDPIARERAADVDARLIADLQRELQYEVNRATRDVERVAAGTMTEAEAAESFMAGGDTAKWLGLGAAGLAAAILLGRSQ